MASASPDSSVTKSALKWKWLGRGLAIAGIGAPSILLPLFFGKVSVYWGMGIVIFGVFLGIQGMALSSFAEIKEAEGANHPLTVVKKKHALLWYTYPNLVLILVGLVFVFQAHMFNVSRVNLSLLLASTTTGILLGGLFGLVKSWLVLAQQIHGETIGEGNKKIQNLSWFFWLLQFIIILITMHNREIICQYFSHTNLSTCAAPMIIFSSFFLGVLLVESFWIFLWEHRPKAKLCM